MDLDETDKAFLDSLLPDGAIPTQVFACITYIDKDGIEHYHDWVQSDNETIFPLLGAIELAKFRLIDNSRSIQEE